MLIAVLALAWVVVGVVWLLGRLRESREERSISHFHEEHEVLSRRGYSVAPAQRLEDIPSYLDDVAPATRTFSRRVGSSRRATVPTPPPAAWDQPEQWDSDSYRPVEVNRVAHPSPRPALRLVSAHDETSASNPWDRWDRENTWDGDVFASPTSFDHDEYVESVEEDHRHRYAAYQRVPLREEREAQSRELRGREFPPATAHPRMSMRRRRRLAGTVVVGSALATSALDQVVPSALLRDVSYVSWASAGLYAVAYAGARAAGLVGSPARRINPPVRLAYQNDEEEGLVWGDASEAPEYSRRDAARFALG